MKTKHLFTFLIAFFSTVYLQGQTNLFSGTGSGASITTGTYNVGFGHNTLNANAAGGNNSAIGFEVLKNATSSGNTGVGSLALTSTTSGAGNSAFGFQSLKLNTSGISNVGIGSGSLFSNTTGNNNVSVGVESLNQNTTSSNNTALGHMSLYYNDGNGNTALGSGALFQWHSAVQANSYNIGIGVESGMFALGNNNIFIGNRAGVSCVGSGNVILGRPAQNLAINNTIIFATETSGSSPGTEYVRINATGMGIATSAPTKKLDVNGEARIRTLPVSTTNSYFLSVDADGNIKKQLGTATPGTINIYNTSASISGTGDRVVTLDGHNLIFHTTGGSNGKLYIGNNANNPAFTPINGLDDDYNLLVEKGILTERIKVSLRDNANWADYVFAADYKLKSLGEVETFIKENGHLPGIESSSEIVKNGLDLGAMQAKQMEKIEELTLYAIEQQKTIEKQNQKLDKQSQEIEELKAQMKILLGNK